MLGTATNRLTTARDSLAVACHSHVQKLPKVTASEQANTMASRKPTAPATPLVCARSFVTWAS